MEVSSVGIKPVPVETKQIDSTNRPSYQKQIVAQNDEVSFSGNKEVAASSKKGIGKFIEGATAGIATVISVVFRKNIGGAASKVAKFVGSHLTTILKVAKTALSSVGKAIISFLSKSSKAVANKAGEAATMAKGAVDGAKNTVAAKTQEVADIADKTTKAVARKRAPRLTDAQTAAKRNLGNGLEWT